MAEPKYVIRIRDFAASTFGPGDIVAEFETPRNLGYAQYLNSVGEAFFTIYQDHPKAPLLRTAADRGYHMQILRDGVLRWGGWLAETDETHVDTIVYAYDYMSGLYDLVTGWEDTWENETIGAIVTDLWATAQGKTNSRMAWMSTGTIQDPWSASGGPDAYVQSSYKTYYKRILFAIQELVAAAISDTTNTVTFNIWADGTFNLFRNRGRELDLRWAWGDPRILGFRRQRRPVEIRNSIFAVGSTPRDVALRKNAVDNTGGQSGSAAIGKREDSIYLQWVRDQSELDRIAKLRLKRAKRLDADTALTFAPGTLTPFGIEDDKNFRLGDTVLVDIAKGATNIKGSGERKMIVGQQVALLGGSEVVRPILSEPL